MVKAISVYSCVNQILSKLKVLNCMFSLYLEQIIKMTSLYCNAEKTTLMPSQDNVIQKRYLVTMSQCGYNIDILPSPNMPLEIG